jgi:dimethylargininase
MLDRRVLVRQPSSRLAEGLVTHIERQQVDVDLAMRQWDDYVAAIEGAGWDVIQVPPMEECPDGVFIEDDVVMYGDRAIVARPGADERKPETAAIADLLGALGYDVVSIEAPGTLDGGDVLKHDGTVWVGIGGRTNQEGIDQLTAYLEPYGAKVVPVPISKVLHLKSAVTALPDGTVWVGIGGRTNQSGIDQLTAYLEPYGARVVPVPISKVLHLKSAVTALPDGTVVGYGPLVDDRDVWDSFLDVPESSGSHVVLLGGDTILMSTDAPASKKLFEERGLHVIDVDISEFIKLEGCVTCLSVRLRHTP